MLITKLHSNFLLFIYFILPNWLLKHIFSLRLKNFISPRVVVWLQWTTYRNVYENEYWLWTYLDRPINRPAKLVTNLLFDSCHFRFYGKYDMEANMFYSMCFTIERSALDEIGSNQRKQQFVDRMCIIYCAFFCLVCIQYMESASHQILR